MANTTYLRVRDESLSVGGHHPVAGYTIPVTRGLRAAYLFSGGLGLANHNYASGDVQGNVVGSPTEIDRYVRFGPNASIDSGILEEYMVSALVVGRKHPGSAYQPAFIGSTKSDDGGVGLYLPGSSITLRVAVPLGNVNPSVAVTDPTAWGAYAAIAPLTGGLYQVHNLTEGTSTTSTSPDNRVSIGSDTMRIGALIQNPETWDADMLLALWSDVVWTNAELSQLYAWAKSYAADFGISV